MSEDLFYFTSESVSEGHPDKLCDKVSDKILDACMAEDPNSHVACETACKGNWCCVFGEITTKANLTDERIKQIVRDVYKDIGYHDETTGANWETLEIENRIQKQSPEITDAVTGLQSDKSEEDIGAGDQGIMIGFACDECEECIPLTILYAHQLVRKLAELRKNGTLPWLGPDAKSQVTIAYKMDKRLPVAQFVDAIVISTMHDKAVSKQEMREALENQVIKEVIPAHFLRPETKIYINPSGSFIYGGPFADAGLTGRKIIVDSYGGWGGHGGGAFSGKDWTKVDRSGCYLARWIAKSLITNKICNRCFVELSYAIGVAEPISLYIDDFETSQYSRAQIEKIVRANFDMRPGMIAKQLNLKRPIYYDTAAYGHFGRPEFTWEQAKKLDLSCVQQQ